MDIFICLLTQARRLCQNEDLWYSAEKQFPGVNIF